MPQLEMFWFFFNFLSAWILFLYFCSRCFIGSSQKGSGYESRLGIGMFGEKSMGKKKSWESELWEEF